MKSIQALRERRAAKAQEARKLLDDNTGEKWNATIKAQVDALYNEIESIDEQISAHQRQIEIDAENGGGDPEKVKDRLDPKDPKNAGVVLFNKWARVGMEGLNAEERTQVMNTMSTTTGSEGGFTVPTLISSQLIDAMKAFGAMRAVAETIKTADGRPLSFPGSDGTAEVGELLAQNVVATNADPVFTTVSLNVFMYSSKTIAVPFALLQDTTIDIEAFIRKRIAQRLGRIGNQHFTTGTGAGAQPDGVVPRASSGKVGTTGQTLTIIYDDLVDLIHAVDPAYRHPGCAFMTNDSLLRVLRKLKDTAGRPIWMPSYDQGISQKALSAQGGGYSSQDAAVVYDTLMGFPVFVNNDMAVPAANAKTMLFGDHTYYKIRDAMEIQLFRFTDSAYAQKGQTGFMAWSRMGGNLVDTNAVKYYQHSAT